MTDTDMSNPKLARNRAPIRSAGWRGAGESVVSSADQDTAKHLEILARVAPALARSAPALLRVMRDNMTGQPQAAHYSIDGDDDRDPRSKLWCWDHEQSIARCDEAGTDCQGVLLTGPSDPTGNAGVIPDRAQRDRDLFAGHVRRAERALADAWAIASGYPAVAMTPPDPDETPGDDLCRCHWKAKKYPKIIERKSDGSPYYKNLCRWCGITRKVLRGDRLGKHDQAGDPPTWLVQVHIVGTVNQGQIDKAQGQIDRLVAKRKKDAKAKRKRK